MLMEMKGIQGWLRVSLKGLMSLSPVRRSSVLLALPLAALLALLAVACAGEAGTGVDAGSDNGTATRSARGPMTVETYRSPT